MNNTEIEKSKIFDLSELAGYESNSIVARTLVRKNTGTININALDTGQAAPERITPFDTFAHVIDGIGEITVDDKLNTLAAGQCIIIPAHARCAIRATVRFKMILIVIKSGYEDL